MFKLPFQGVFPILLLPDVPLRLHRVMDNLPFQGVIMSGRRSINAPCKGKLPIASGRACGTRRDKKQGKKFALKGQINRDKFKQFISKYGLMCYLCNINKWNNQKLTKYEKCI